MNKKEIIQNNKPVAYISACGGIEVYSIEYGINDYIIFTSNSWNGTPRKKPHKAIIKYNKAGDPYFNFNGFKLSLNDCIRI
jgi:hypothetical protein